MRLIRIIPGLPAVKLHPRVARKGCEHFCFIGAATDLAGFLVHFEAPIVLFMGKAAFVAGAVGIYLLHFEESLPPPPEL